MTLAMLSLRIATDPDFVVGIKNDPKNFLTQKGIILSIDELKSVIACINREGFPERYLIVYNWPDLGLWSP